jgi:two-component system, sensor histidine kinase and response regulator
LKTPVIGSLLVFQRLQNQSCDPVQLSRSMIDRMVESTNRQLKLLESLLAVQVSEHGFNLERQWIHASTFTNDIALDLEPLLSESKATLENTVSPDLPSIYVDEFQLRRVFENLITNALRHNAPGIHLKISASVEHTILKFILEDDGVGIPSQECEQMFERYRQGRRTQRSLGAGLGLYLCRQIIEAHGGKIGVISEIDQGAKFWFTLPTS